MKTLKAVAEKLTSMPFVDAYLSVHMAYVFAILTNARLSDDEAILSRMSPVVEMLSQVVRLSGLRAGMLSGTETSPRVPGSAWALWAASLLEDSLDLPNLSKRSGALFTSF